MVLNTTLLIGALFLIVACQPPSNRNETTGEYDGELIYTNYCVSCHGSEGDRGLGNAADLTKSDLTEAEMRQVILYGTPNGMAAYKPVLKSEEEIKELVKHVKSLRRD